MQSLFLACYLCLQLIALNNPNQDARTQKNASCDQCVTRLVDKFHLPPELTNVLDFLAIKKPTAQIMPESQDKKVPEQPEQSEQPEQQPPIAEEPKEIEYKGKSIVKRNERIKVGEFLVSENGKFKMILNHYGEFETFDSQGKLIRNSGSCDTTYYNDGWNWLMDSDNSWILHHNINEDAGHFKCPSVCPVGSHECYMKLDNDGILSMFDENGKSAISFTFNKLTSPYQKKNIEPDLSTESVYQGPSSLKRNQRLKVGESLVSENGKYKITLNKYGQLETVNSKGKLIRNSGSCDNNLPVSDTWNILMDSHNSMKLYRTMEDTNYSCISVSSRHCIQPGAVCYLMLDNDGVLKLFDEQGQIEFDFTFNKLDYDL